MVLIGSITWSLTALPIIRNTLARIWKRAAVLAVMGVAEWRLKRIGYDWFYEQLIGEKAPKTPEHETARRFINLIRDINREQIWVSRAAGVIEPTLSSVIRDIYGAYIWSLGLGWLSWVALSPFLEAVIANPLRDSFYLKYRPTGPSRTMLEEWRKRDIITDAKAKEELARLGYADEYIELILKNLEAEISDSERKKVITEVVKAYKEGAITEAQAEAALSQLGMKKAQIDYVLMLKRYHDLIEAYKEKLKEPKDVTKEERRKVVNALLKAYIEDAIPRSVFEEELRKRNFTDEEIKELEKVKELYDKIEKHREELKPPKDVTKDEKRRLFTAILRALREDVISKEEGFDMLRNYGWTEDELKIIEDYLSVYDKIDEKRKAKEHVEERVEYYKEKELIRKIITQAITNYKEGYITQDKLMQILTSYGIPNVIADLLIKYADWKYQFDYYMDLEREIKEAYRKDLLTQEQAKELLSKIIVRPERIEAKLAYWTYQKLPKPKFKFPSLA